MEEIIVEIVIPCCTALWGVVGTIVAFFKGKKAKKENSSYTQVEQENVLYRYMVDQCKQAESTVLLLRKDLPKEEVAKFKRTTVLDKISMFAKGSGYVWYDEEVWAQKLTDFIRDTKECQKK